MHDATGRGQMEALCLDLSGPCPPASLPLTDFNPYPFTVINCNHEYKSIQ